jgi:hypothetical protein
LQLSDATKLDANQTWPTGPLTLTFPSSVIPATTTACAAFDMTVVLNATYLERGIVTFTQDVVPIKITPVCLNTNVIPPVTKASGSVPVQITKSSSYSAYAQVTATKIPFLIDFTEKVLEVDPLKLFNVTGANRTDVVYEPEAGRIYLMVYPNDVDESTTIT